MTLAYGHAEHAWKRRGMYVSRGIKFSMRGLYAYQIPVLDLQLCRGLRINLNRQTPHRTRDRIGQFLHPWQIGARAVMELERKVGLKLERELVGRAGESGIGELDGLASHSFTVVTRFFFCRRFF